MMKDMAGTFLTNFFEKGDKRYLDRIKNEMKSWHLVMLTDQTRLEFYRSIIDGQVNDKHVLDIGSGTGILTWLAIQAGAKKIYAVEKDQFMCELSSHLLASEISAGKVVIINKDAKDLSKDDLPVAPAIVLHEIFAADGLREGVREVFNNLNERHLLENARILPASFRILVEPVTIKDPEVFITLKDFEGYPLSKLQPFVEYRETSLNYQISKTIGIIREGKARILYETCLNRPCPTDKIKLTWEEGKISCTHLRVWIELVDGPNVLTTDHLRSPSHWANLFYQLPERAFSSANFEILHGFLRLRSVD